MGMHFGLVAVPADIRALRDGFASAWPHLEVVAAAGGLQGPQALSDWMSAHTQRGHAGPGRRSGPDVDAYGFTQQGPWAVLLDGSYVLASDEDALATLSRRFGRALSFVVETTGGCAYFLGYAQGTLQRSIACEDGQVRAQGDALPEEAGIDMATFYMDEAEALLAAFGLHPFDAGTAYDAIAAADHTDDGALPPARPPAGAGRPWWKFW